MTNRLGRLAPDMSSLIGNLTVSFRQEGEGRRRYSLRRSLSLLATVFRVDALILPRYRARLEQCTPIRQSHAPAGPRMAFAVGSWSTNEPRYFRTPWVARASDAQGRVQAQLDACHAQFEVTRMSDRGVLLPYGCAKLKKNFMDTQS